MTNAFTQSLVDRPIRLSPCQRCIYAKPKTIAEDRGAMCTALDGWKPPLRTWFPNMSGGYITGKQLRDGPFEGDELECAWLREVTA